MHKKAYKVFIYTFAVVIYFLAILYIIKKIVTHDYSIGGFLDIFVGICVVSILLAGQLKAPKTPVTPEVPNQERK